MRYPLGTLFTWQGYMIYIEYFLLWHDYMIIIHWVPSILKHGYVISTEYFMHSDLVIWYILSTFYSDMVIWYPLNFFNILICPYYIHWVLYILSHGYMIHIEYCLLWYGYVVSTEFFLHWHCYMIHIECYLNLDMVIWYIWSALVTLKLIYDTYWLRSNP